VPSRRVIYSVLIAVVVVAGFVVAKVHYDGSGMPWGFANGTTQYSLGNTQAVSCPTSHFCGLVDLDSVLIWRNGKVENTRANLPENPSGRDFFNSISCPTTTFCLAVTFGGLAEYYIGGHWLGHTRVTSTNSDGLNTVSCASPNFCLAGSTADEGYVFDGRSWTDVGSPQPSVAEQQSGEILSDSCVKSKVCYVGTGMFNPGAADGNGQTFEFSGGSWTPSSNVVDNAISAIGCSDPDTCVAGTNGAQYLTFTLSSWSDPNQLDLPSGTPDLNGIVGASCPGVAGECCVLDSGGAVYSIKTIRSLSPTLTQVVPDAAILGPALSCPPNGHCFLVDGSLYESSQ
jgi:hypothetical protein